MYFFNLNGATEKPEWRYRHDTAEVENTEVESK